MTVLTPTAPGAKPPPIWTVFKLRGLTWLVWRQHRASFRLWMACALVLTGYLVYLHATYTHYLSSQAGQGADPSSVSPDAGFSVAALLLYLAPLVAAAAFGAQLFEREYTEGTFQLVCAQSVAGTAWVRAKLLVPAVMVLVCVTPCAAALTWDYELDPYRRQIFLSREVFQVVGPAAISLTLLGFLLGAVSGLILRRNGAAPILSLFLALGFKLLLSGLPSLLHRDAQSVDGLLQWVTTGICLLLSAGLAVLCRSRIRQRPY